MAESRSGEMSPSRHPVVTNAGSQGNGKEPDCC